MSADRDSRACVPRSYLFVPADRPDRVLKACTSQADAVIVDLEDAVETANKATARELLFETLPKLPKPVFVRINAASTQWYRGDLQVASQDKVEGLVLPKAESVDELDDLATASAGLPVLALIETARGMARVQEIAACSVVRRLLFGSIDFSVDLGIAGESESLLMFHSQLVLASRLAGLPAPVDGVTRDFRELERLQHETHRARQLGFGGKLCIHPRQIDVVNRTFVPDADSIAWARRILQAGEGASQVDGAMVDKAVVEQARRILGAARVFGVPT